MSNSAFSPSVLTVPSGTTGSGQGELNLITNPVAASDTTGWSPATGRGTSGGPLSPTIDTYFTVLNTAGSESSTSGAYGVISLPSGLQNKKLKVEFYFTSPALDTFNVSVYKGTTRVPLTTDVSGSTALPQNTTGKFVAYFDTDSSGTWTLSITRTAGTGATALQFTNVVVGPGIQPQGAVVGEWQSYTGTVQNGGTATFTYSSRQWRRIGDSLELDYEFQVSANGSGSSFIYMPLPAGLSVDFVKAPSSTVLGSGFSILGSTMDSTRLPRTITGLQGVGIYVSTGALQGSGLVSGTNFAVKAMVPIAEWAGSGTVQLAQNDTSFAADDGTNDVFGPSGAAVPTIGLGTGVTTRSFTYQEPLQQQDNFRVEFQFAVGEAWYPAEYHFPWLQTAATDYYGLSLMQTGSSVMITFGNRGGRPSAGIGSNGLAWNTAWRWRVRKSSAGAAVGFGIVQPGCILRTRVRSGPPWEYYRECGSGGLCGGNYISVFI
jgi:hypothetical protein